MLVMTLEVVVYQAENGSCPFDLWFNEIDARAAAKVADAVRRMGQGNLAEVKGVGSGVMERRIDWGPGYRVYFGRDGERSSCCSEAARRSVSEPISRMHTVAGQITDGAAEPRKRA